MKIKTFLGGYDKNLSYLVWCETTGLAGIVDAAVDITEILEFINSKTPDEQSAIKNWISIQQEKRIKEESNLY